MFTTNYGLIYKLFPMNNYKKILLPFLFPITLLACKKYDGDSYDFSDKSPNYIRFTPGQEIVFNSETVDTTIDGEDYFYYLEDVQSFKIETRVSATKDIGINYIIMTESGFSQDMTTVLSRQKNSQVEEISLPSVAFESTDSVVTGQLKLTATNANLRIGYPDDADNAAIDFIAYKPNVLHKY